MEKVKNNIFEKSENSRKLPGEPLRGQNNTISVQIILVYMSSN